MIVHLKYACCGVEHAVYVGQGSQDASLASDASEASQNRLGCSKQACVCFVHMHASAAFTWLWTSGCVCQGGCMAAGKCSVCDSLPVGSLSRCCLAGGSSVSQGVSWLMGVCPHLTPGASSSPWVWPSPGDIPDTYNKKNKSDVSHGENIKARRNLSWTLDTLDLHKQAVGEWP